MNAAPWFARGLPLGIAALIALFLGVYGPLRVANLAAEGRQPLLKWQPAFEALDSGDSPYAPADAAGEGEGLPTPPFAALVLRPFLAFGPVAGCVAFALVKLAAIFWMVRTAVVLARGSDGRNAPYPPWAWAILAALGLRVVLSDVVHGNTNTLVAATVVGAAAAWRVRLDALCGLLIGIGAAFKLTPALFVVLLLAKRSRDGLLGMLAGLLLFGLATPGAVFGFGRHLGLLGDYARQMIAPFASATAPGPMQSNQLNQSLTGVAARWLGDNVAIQARPGVWDAPVRINVAELDGDLIAWLVRAVSVAIVGLLAWRFARSRPRAGVESRSHSGFEFGALALAMLLISERSWKHHFVPALLPLALLAGVACGPARSGRGVARAALAAWAACVSASGSGVLGERGSDLAEAFGSFALAALVLLAACVRFSGSRPSEPEPTV